MLFLSFPNKFNCLLLSINNKSNLNLNHLTSLPPINFQINFITRTSSKKLLILLIPNLLLQQRLMFPTIQRIIFPPISKAISAFHRNAIVVEYIAMHVEFSGQFVHLTVRFVIAVWRCLIITASF